MRTRKRREEIITTLQKKPFTQDFRGAAGLATWSGLCDPERPEKHTLPTDSSFSGRGKKWERGCRATKSVLFNLALQLTESPVVSLQTIGRDKDMKERNEAQNKWQMCVSWRVCKNKIFVINCKWIMLILQLSGERDFSTSLISTDRLVISYLVNLQQGSLNVKYMIKIYS